MLQSVKAVAEFNCAIQDAVGLGDYTRDKKLLYSLAQDFWRRLRKAIPFPSSLDVHRNTEWIYWASSEARSKVSCRDKIRQRPTSSRQRVQPMGFRVERALATQTIPKGLIAAEIENC